MPNDNELKQMQIMEAIRKRLQGVTPEQESQEMREAMTFQPNRSSSSMTARPSDSELEMRANELRRAREEASPQLDLARIAGVITDKQPRLKSPNQAMGEMGVMTDADMDRSPAMGETGAMTDEDKNRYMRLKKYLKNR